jgi:GT2 family glycosyltransferase
METETKTVGATPVKTSADADTVTFALFAYNQEGYIREAVRAALAQACNAIEIIISDDCSTDATFQLIKDAVADYSGPHSIKLNQNAKNLGLADHVNKIFEMASGSIIVVAAGDDISLPSRVSDTIATFQKYPAATMVSFVDEIIDDDSNIVLDRGSQKGEVVVDLSSFVDRGPLAQRKLQISGASRALRKSVVTSFGELQSDCPAEDTPYVLRSLYLGLGIICQWPGIRYRLHNRQLSNEGSIASMSSASFTRQFLSDLETAIRIGLLDARLARRVRNWVRERELSFRLRRMEFRGGRPSIGVVASVLRSAHIPAREKAGMVKRYMTPGWLIALLGQPFGKKRS